MEIHPFERAWLGVSLVLIVAWIGTVTYGAVGAGVQMVDDSGGTVDPQLIADGEYEATEFREPGVYETDGGYAAYVVANRFAFRPDPIRLPAGEEITFYVTTGDVIHGFEVVGTNVNTMVIPGQIAEITVVFDRPGEYGLICNEYCGAGHHTMEGRIVVVPADEYGGEQ